MWTPDVYEGAPTSVTAYLAVASKAASFGAFVRVFMEALGGLKANWQLLLVAICIATMILGNVVAIVQSNIKRMLAYSSIAHAGYALIGLVVADVAGTAGVLLYLALYAFMTLGAFAVVSMLRKGGLEGDEISDFTGLAKRNKWAALLMLLFMVSLTGIPPTAGFIAKVDVFGAAVRAGHWPLVLIAVLGSVVAAFFYLRVVVLMYMQAPVKEEAPAAADVPPAAASLPLLVPAVLTLALGVFPEIVLGFLRQAAVLRW
jgi:NADH-quinone oxidoreductase subunit N